MPAKDILVLLDTINEKQIPAKMALELAARFDAHVTGLAIGIEPVLPSMVMVPVPPETIEVARKQAESEARRAIDQFEAMASSLGVRYESRSTTAIAAIAPDVLASHARLTDLVVIGQDNPDSEEPQRSLMIETALFSSARPILLIPYIGVEKLSFDKVMVAWDGSQTAARAIYASLPILAHANDITVLIVDDGREYSGEPGADLATYLSRHGLSVTIKHGPPVGGVANTMLNTVADNGIDMVVMGGYGHSRFREMILGGATQDMLQSMTVPVLMAH